MRKKIMIVVIGMTLITMLAGYGCHEKNTKYESAMQNADSYLKESDFESALGCYDSAAKLEPKSAIPLIKMADIYITQKLKEKAALKATANPPSPPRRFCPRRI